MDLNHLCGRSDCDQFAKFFGIMNNSQKMKRCAQHFSDLSDKQLIFHDIEGVQFIQTAADIAEYKERKEKCQRVRGNLGVLEAGCVQELDAALEQIDARKANAFKAIDAAYKECEMRVRAKFESVHQSFLEIRTCLDLYVQNKETQLSEVVEQLTKEQVLPLRFLRFVMEDPISDIVNLVVGKLMCTEESVEDVVMYLKDDVRSDRVAKMIATVRNTSTSGSPTSLLEQLTYAIRLGSQGDFTNLTAFLEHRVSKDFFSVVKLFLATWDESDVKKLAERNRTRALAEISSCNFSKALAYYQKALNRLTKRQILDESKVQFGVEMGRLLCVNLAEYRQAESALRESVKVAERVPAASDLAIAAEYEIGMISYQQELFTEAEIHFGEVINKRGSASSLALLRLVSMYQKAHREESALTLIDSYREFIAFQGASIIGLLIEAYELDMKNAHSAAKQKYTDALPLLKDALPGSLELIECLNSLGTLQCTLGEYTEAEQVLKEAVSLSARHCPDSLQASISLSNLGALYYTTRRLADAEMRLSDAHAVLKDCFPEALSTAVNCLRYGRLKSDQNRMVEAEVLMNRGYEIAKKLDKCLEVECLDCLAQILMNTQRVSDAHHLLTEARTLVELNRPGSVLMAKALRSLGDLHCLQQNFSDAESLYLHARELYSRFPPSIQYASCINRLGLLWQQMGKVQDAEGCFFSAMELFSVINIESSESASNVYDLGALYESVGRDNDAMEKFKSAIHLSQELPNCAVSVKARKALDRLQSLEGVGEKMLRLVGNLFTSQRKKSA